MFRPHHAGFQPKASSGTPPVPPKGGGSSVTQQRADLEKALRQFPSAAGNVNPHLRTALQENLPAPATAEPKPPGAVPPATEQPEEIPAKRFGATAVIFPNSEEQGPTIVERKRADGGTDHDVFVLSPIGGASFLQGLLDIVQILRYASEADTIHFYISSPGGSVNSLGRVLSAMKATKAQTVTHAIGPCCSAAAPWWAAGKTRVMEPGSYLMFHMSSHGDWGNSRGIAASAAHCVDYITQLTLQPMVAQGILTEQELFDVVERKADVYIPATEVARRLEGRGNE